mmetsp:Transcript_20586/g.29486  ORF Transcript_20586/g.29486 Transcript_20586/m.29486 type:complete len:708 (-) Transcript_20586:910-3033(-)
MNRDEFIASLIFELSIQQKTLPNSNVVDDDFENRALNIYRKLCYDFPLLPLGSAAEIERFSKDIRCMSFLLLEYSCRFSGFNQKYSKFANVFSLNDVFVNNVTEYIPSLLQSPPTVEVSKNIQESLSALSALTKTLFLQLPKAILTSFDRTVLSRLFASDMATIHAAEDLSTEEELLEWREICLHFKNFIVQSSASSLFHSSLALSRESNASADELEGMQALVACISCLTSVASGTKPEGAAVTLEMFLTQSLQDEDQNSTDKAVAADTVRACWLHLTMLCRDAFIRRPDLLKLSCPPIAHHPAQGQGAGPILSILQSALLRGPPFSAGETAWLFFLGSLSSALSVSGSDESSLAEGRAALLLPLREGALWLADTCRRLGARRSAASPQPSLLELDCDPVGCLLDAARLLVGPQNPAALLQHSFTAGRVLPELLRLLLVWLGEDRSTWQQRDGPLRPASPPLLAHSQRLVWVVSTACFRCPPLAEFAVRYPGMLAALRSHLSIWTEPARESLSSATVESKASAGSDSSQALRLTRGGLLLAPHLLLGLLTSLHSQFASSTGLLHLLQRLAALLEEELTLLVSGESAGISEREAQRAQQTAATQLQQMAQTVDLLAMVGSATSAPIEDVRGVLTSMCSRCLQTLLVSTSRPDAGLGLGLSDNREEEEEAAEEQLQFEETLRGVKALLRKKLKALQSILDSNLSSSKVD